MTADPRPLLYHLRRLAAAPSTLSDAELLERFLAQRDEESFALVVARHGPMVLRLCRRLVGEPHLAEDCFQATFLILARNAASVRRRSSLAAWLHGVALRVARRALTTARRRRGLPLGQDEGPADRHGPPLAELSARELLTAVDEEVQQLPEAYRLPVILCCLEGHTREEAARLLGWTPGSVKGRLERGRERLHRRLSRRGLTLAMALSALEVSRGLAMPHLPRSLAAATVQGAVRFAAGQAITAGMVSASAAQLGKEVVKEMLMKRIKVMAAGLLGLALVATGILGLSRRTEAEDPPQLPTAASKLLNALRPQENGQPQDDGIAWGKATGGLQAGIAFRPGDEQKGVIGQSVTFVVVVRNVGRKVVRLSHTECLFVEDMPVVKTADGKRLGVATSPFHTGDVPIVQRTVEPGEQIILGYPWLRLRPPGWRGEVVAPTLCAGPGRYTVQYSGLPLQLQEDASRYLSPATGPLVLQIEQREPVQKQLPAGSDRSGTDRNTTAGDGAGEVYSVNHRTIKIPFSFNRIRERVRGVVLFVSEDKGLTWKEHSKAAPTARDLRFTAPYDGEYWLKVAIEDEQGLLDSRGAKVAMRVCVDTTSPVVSLHQVALEGKEVAIAWKVRDENLDLNSLCLEHRRKDSSSWVPLPVDRKASSGSYGWSRGADAEGEVRLRVRDRAGNEAETTTRLSTEWPKDSQVGLTASPAVVRMAALEEGEETSCKVVIRGPKPFRLIRVDGAARPLRLHFPTGGKSQAVHTVYVSVTGPARREWALRFHTDLGADFEPVEVKVHAGEEP
jgi:RNA polymerase sigma factor (sigma-70 family)